jgi:hypothetical protein
MRLNLLLDKPLDLEDELLNFTADLLALKINQIVLEGLFGLGAGEWVNLGELLETLPEMAQQLTEFERVAGGQLQVTWLRHPETSESYCLVLFFMESLSWDSLAIYNRSLIAV